MLGTAGRRGATFGLCGVIAALVAYQLIAKRVASNPLILLAMLIALAQALVAALALVLAGSIAQRLPRLHRVLIGTLAFSIVLEYLGTPPLGLFVLVAIAVVFPALLGSGLLALASASAASAPWTRRLVPALAAAVGTAGCAAAIVFFAADGRLLRAGDLAAHERGPTTTPGDATWRATEQTGRMQDPSRPGPYHVRTLTYGSAHDRWRPEYGARVDVVTRPVDGSELAEGWTGLAGWARTRFWGFDLRSLPLQGRVWYPEGVRHAPLVVAVHGSHRMEDFSDPGYEYLGRRLASRGFVVASIDENFLNGSDADSGLLPGTAGRLREEMDLRAWLLLEHLRLFREWSATPDSRLGGLVDLDDVALLGHSKGGEAIAVAAALNRLPFHPDDARVAFDYGFGIRALVAFAPTDGLYRPASLATRLQDVDYLVLHGSHDMDVQSFVGTRQFSRVSFSGHGSHLKEAVYVHRANHGQFNSVWGRTDYSRTRMLLFDRSPLMSGDEQRRIASVFVAAFLEATLHGDATPLPFLRDERVGRDWLPNTTLVTDYQDSATRIVCNFEEDVDLTTTTLEGGSTRGEGLSLWREGQARLKWGSRDTGVVSLGWNRDSGAAPASYTVRLPPGSLQLDERTALVFALADVAAAPPGSAPGSEPGALPEPVDLAVELTDANGAAARLPLSSFEAFQPRLTARVAKAPFFGDAPPSEPVYQSFELPLAAFVRQNPELRPHDLASVRFVFDRTRRRVVSLDDLGFRPNDPGFRPGPGDVASGGLPHGRPPDALASADRASSRAASAAAAARPRS